MVLNGVDGAFGWAVLLGPGLRATWPWLQSTMDGLALDQGTFVNRDPRDVYWYYGYAQRLEQFYCNHKNQMP